MADVAAFSALLGRLGFNAPTVALITSQGLSTIDELQRIPITQVDPMMQHLSKWRNPGVAPVAGAPAPLLILFPFLTVRNLKALRAWCDYRILRDQDCTPNLYVDATALRFMARLTALEDVARMKAEVKPPTALASMASWTTWEEECSTYLGQHRSAIAETPLTYILRPHIEVTPQMLTATYDTVDEDLYTTAKLETGPYIEDNKRLYDLLKPLIIKGPGWPFIQPFNRARDGRGAYMALKAQAEGRSAIATRKAQAYALIATAKYTGKSKAYSIDQYVARHQKAHNELLELQEPVAEAKKVVDFLAGITDPKLDTAKAVIDGDNLKLTSFEECQQYIKTVSTNAMTRAVEPSRQVSAVQKNPRHKQKRTPTGNEDDRTPSGVKIHPGKYDAKEYNKLKPFERAEVKRLREERDSKTTEKKARTVATVTSEPEEESQSGAVTPPSILKNAGVQFGRSAHGKEKK